MTVAQGLPRSQARSRAARKGGQRLRAPFPLRCGALLIDYIALVSLVVLGTLVSRLLGGGGRAAGLHHKTSQCLFGRPLTLADPSGGEIDLGRVGEVTRVDSEQIENLCLAGVVPVLPSLAETEGDPEGLLNVNADTAATAVATAVGAEKLVFLSDVNGVRRDKNNPESLIHSLTAQEAEAMIRSGAIEAGMIPKVQACLETLNKGVRKIHIIDGRLRHSLLLEIYTSRGVGTEIVAGN